MNASCCPQGQERIRFYEKCGTWELCPDNKQGNCLYTVSYCPFCGEFLRSYRSIEEELEEILKTSRPGRICFDVDGVIANDKEGKSYSERSPYPWAAPLLTRFRKAGYTIIFHTARYMVRYNGDQRKAHEVGRMELVWWLRSHNIPFDEVYFGKPSADFYVDDRGCRVNSNNGPGDWIRSFLPLLKARA